MNATPPDIGDRKPDFFNPTPGTYLNTAAESLLLKGAIAALMEYAIAKAQGEPGRRALFAAEQECKVKVARLLNVTADEIAFACNTTDAINTLVLGLTWAAGDNVVITDLGYPSNVLPWLKLKQRGVEVRLVPSHDRVVGMDDLARAMDSRTRLLAVDFVSYKSGFRTDLAAAAALAHEHGTLILVDAIQGLGVVPLDAQELDFLVAGTYKWLLGIHGLALLYVNRKVLDRVEPPFVGWRSVDDIFAPDRFETYRLASGMGRFNTGMPSFPAMFVLNQSLDYLAQVGQAGIESRVVRLGTLLLEGLQRMHLPVLTPDEPALRAGIVSFATPRYLEIMDTLARQDVHIFGMDGRVRISPHLYNGEADIQVFLDALRRVI